MTELFLDVVVQYGYVAIFIFAMFDHTGTPGAVMIAAGLAASGALNIWGVLLISIIGGLAGDWLLYALGRWAGAPLLRYAEKKNKNISEMKQKIHMWMKKYGGTVIIWSRFVAIVGRYASFVYGIFRYPIAKFTLYSLLGGALMVLVFGLPTYYIGGKLNTFVENPFFTFYLTTGIIILQILISAGIYYIKQTKKQK